MRIRCFARDVKRGIVWEPCSGSDYLTAPSMIFEPSRVERDTISARNGGIFRPFAIYFRIPARKPLYQSDSR